MVSYRKRNVIEKNEMKSTQSFLLVSGPHNVFVELHVRLEELVDTVLLENVGPDSADAVVASRNETPQIVHPRPRENLFLFLT